ncbi:MAG: hypothetical protein ACUVS2_17990 [Candidatus Flexifilum sp.]
MPYQSGGGRRNNVQLGVGQSIWAGTPPAAIPERTLDGIPGCLALIALALSIVLAVAFPYLLLVIVVAVASYSALRFLLAGIANFIGLRQIKRWEQIDWTAYYHAHAHNDALPWEAVRHIVIIPAYKEPPEVLARTLLNLAAQFEARKRMTVVLAMEAAEPSSAEKAEGLIAEYGHHFAHCFYTVHPRGLPGEMQCKSANQAWAARWIKRTLVDEAGYNIDHLVVTTQDADTLWHPHHFWALTALFALNPKRYLSFWQAPIRYHGNIWQINPLLRIVNAYSTAFELAYLAAPWWSPLPMSSYSLSLKLLDISGYWDSDVIADEWHMFIKAYFARGGVVELERIFLPFLAQAVTGDNLFEALKNRYQQTLRHAWGSKEVGYMVAKIFEHPEIEFLHSLRLLLRIAHDILLAGAGWVIMTVGSQLPFILHPRLFTEIIGAGFSNPLFAILQAAFGMVTILGIVFWYQDVIVRPPRTVRQTWAERLWTLISFPALPILTLFLVAIPTLQAQFRLLAGIPLQFRVSKKI